MLKGTKLIKTKPNQTFTKLHLSQNIYHTFTGFAHSKRLSFDSVTQIQPSTSVLHYIPVTKLLDTHYGIHKIQCPITPDSNFAKYHFYNSNGSQLISESAASKREENKVLRNKLTSHGNLSLSLSLTHTHTQCQIQYLNLTDNSSELISIKFPDTNLPNIYLQCSAWFLASELSKQLALSESLV
jgi:hypothetical protein